MFGKFGLLAFVLSASAACAMPGTMSIDISPTVPCVGDPIDLRSDLARPAHPVVLQVAPLFSQKCVPSLRSAIRASEPDRRLAAGEQAG